MTNPNTVRPEEELCKCAQWARFGQTFLTKHHRNCEKYAPEQEAKEIIEALLQGIIDWANDGDGIHRYLFRPFKRACYFVGHPEWIKDD